MSACTSGIALSRLSHISYRFDKHLHGLQCLNSAHASMAKMCSTVKQNSLLLMIPHNSTMHCSTHHHVFSHMICRRHLPSMISPYSMKYAPNKDQLILKDKGRVFYSNSVKVIGRKIVKEKIFTVPNILCFSRMLMTPVICSLTLTGLYTPAVILLCIAGATDLFDGLVARWYPNQASKLGSFLDPLADKLLVATLFISLSYIELIPLGLTLLVVSRDIGLITAAAVVRYHSMPRPINWLKYFNIQLMTIQIQPPFISKLNTSLQLGLVFSTLVAASMGYSDGILLQLLWSATVGTTVTSGLWYVLLRKNLYK